MPATLNSNSNRPVRNHPPGDPSVGDNNVAFKQVGSSNVAPSNTRERQVWFDGELVDEQQADVSLATHALHYGSGVFEGIRCYANDEGGAVFRLTEHLQRMHRGAEVLGLDFDPDQARDAVMLTLRANGDHECYIRPLAWHGSGGLGLDVGAQRQHFMVATLPWKNHLADNQVRATVSSYQRIPASSVPPLKLCGMYINSILAKREATQRGFGEALFVDRDNNVVECTGENVFMVRDGEITAVSHSDALPGITRQTIIELTGAEQRGVSLEELLDADEVFVTGTSAEVVTVTALDQREFADPVVGRELNDLYGRIVHAQVPEYRHWLSEF